MNPSKVATPKVLRQTKIGKNCDEFDRKVLAKRLFKFLKSHPSCIKLFQFVVRKKGYAFIEETVEAFNKDVSFSSFSPFVFIRKCKRCDVLLDPLIMPDFNFKVSRIKNSSCPKCGLTAAVYKENVKLYLSRHIFSLFYYGMRCGIFSSFQRVVCKFCKRDERLRDNQKEVSINCGRCGKPIEIILGFEINDKINKTFDVEEAQGYWFEWFITYLIRNMSKTITVKRNQIWRIGTAEREADGIIERKGKIAYLNCSTERRGKFDNESFHLWKQIGQVIILATAEERIPDKIVACAKDSFQNKVIEITINDFDDISSKIKNISVLLDAS